MEEAEAWQGAALAEEATTGDKGCSGKSWCCWHTKVLALSIFSHPRMPASWLFFPVIDLRRDIALQFPLSLYTAASHCVLAKHWVHFFFPFPFLFSPSRVKLIMSYRLFPMFNGIK